MKISSHSIQHHLAKERENNSPTAILFAQISLFSTSLFLHKTALSSKRDTRGIKTALAYHTLALLLPFSESVLSQLKISRRTNGCKVNIIANCSCLALAILFEKFYEKTLAGLGVVLSMAVLVILLLVIIRPRSDLGFFGFLMGVTGSVSYDLYHLGYKTWVVAAICFVLLGFKFWLDYNWLAVEEENLTSSTRSRENKTFSKSIVLCLLVSETLIVVAFFVYWDFYLLRITGCSRDSSNCMSSFLRWAICLSMLCLWFTVAIVRYLCVRGIDREEMSKKTEVKVDIESLVDQKTEENVDDDDKQLQQVSLKTDTVKQRPKQSRVAEFTKILGHSDVNKAMIIPSYIMKYLPEFSRGSTTNIYVKDEFSQQVWNFGLLTRKEGHPKPAMVGDWHEFRRQKDLKIGDRITFYVHDDNSFSIIAEKKVIGPVGEHIWEPV